MECTLLKTNLLTSDQRINFSDGKKRKESPEKGQFPTWFCFSTWFNFLYLRFNISLPFCIRDFSKYNLALFECNRFFSDTSRNKRQWRSFGLCLGGRGEEVGLTFGTEIGEGRMWGWGQWILAIHERDWPQGASRAGGKKIVVGEDISAVRPGPAISFTCWWTLNVAPTNHHFLATGSHNQANRPSP